VRRPTPLPPPVRRTDAPAADATFEDPRESEPRGVAADLRARFGGAWGRVTGDEAADRDPESDVASDLGPGPSDPNGLDAGRAGFGAGRAPEAEWPGLDGSDAGLPTGETASAGATAADAEAAGTEAPDAETPDRPLTARDVWAAARARRKALRAEVRRFTVRQRRRRMAWLIGIGAVVLTVLGTVAAAYSPLFAVRDIEVVGTSMLDQAQVTEALEGQLGTPLPLVDSSEVKAALVAFPLVESYTLEARPPHSLVVRIVERTPIGTVESASGFTLMDAAGVALATTEDRPDGYPVLNVSGGVHSKAFAAAGAVFRSLPDDLAKRVTKVSATTPNDVTLTLSDPKTTVVWGTSDDAAYKAVVLEAAMKAAPDRSRYDVSAPNAVVTR